MALREIAYLFFVHVPADYMVNAAVELFVQCVVGEDQCIWVGADVVFYTFVPELPCQVIGWRAGDEDIQYSQDLLGLDPSSER